MLDRREYDIVNQIIKDIYRLKDSRHMRRTVLETLRTILKYDMAVFSLGKRKRKDSILVDCVVVSDFDKSVEDEFIYLSETDYSLSDYASWIFHIPETIVYRDSDLVNPELMKKTLYYTDYLLAYNLPYLSGISLVHDQEFVGALTLYRKGKHGDFSDKEMYILQYLSEHLEVRLAEEKNQNDNYRKNVSYVLKSSYGLTSREIEILRWIFKGKSNGEISDTLGISSYTVKKHISNIYDKLSVSSRSQLVQFILDNEFMDLL